MIHPIWLIFLSLNTVFAVVGSAMLGNKYLPFVIAIINVIFMVNIYIQKGG